MDVFCVSQPPVSHHEIAFPKDPAGETLPSLLASEFKADERTGGGIVGEMQAPLGAPIARADDVAPVEEAKGLTRHGGGRELLLKDEREEGDEKGDTAPEALT